MDETNTQEAAPQAFFTDPANLQVITEFKRMLDVGMQDERPVPDVVGPLGRILHGMVGARARFDASCRFNIDWIGEQFIASLREYPRLPPDQRQQRLIDLFTMAYRFYREFEMSAPDMWSHEGTFLRNFVEDNLGRFAENERSQLVYAAYMMPADVLKHLLHAPVWHDLRRVAADVSRAEQLKRTWDGELAAKQQHLDALAKKIDELKVRYNFVALSKGFQDMLEQKHRDLRRAYLALLALGGVMLLPVAIQTIFVMTHIDQIDAHKATLMYGLPGILTLEILLFYFFRVALTHYNSLKAQILQLDLRVSLCQFIESYAEYAKRIRTDDKSALDRFEQLIFSGLVASEGDIPSTFDGVEQIGKILSALKGKE